VFFTDDISWEADVAILWLNDCPSEVVIAGVEQLCIHIVEVEDEGRIALKVLNVSDFVV